MYNKTKYLNIIEQYKRSGNHIPRKKLAQRAKIITEKKYQAYDWAKNTSMKQNQENKKDTFHNNSNRYSKNVSIQLKHINILEWYKCSSNHISSKEGLETKNPHPSPNKRQDSE